MLTPKGEAAPSPVAYGPGLAPCPLPVPCAGRGVKDGVRQTFFSLQGSSGKPVPQLGGMSLIFLNH